MKANFDLNGLEPLVRAQSFRGELLI